MKVVDRRKRAERIRNKIKRQKQGQAKSKSSGQKQGYSRTSGQNRSSSGEGIPRSRSSRSDYVYMPYNSKGYDRFRASRRFPDDIKYEEPGSKPSEEQTETTNQETGNNASANNAKPKKSKGKARNTKAKKGKSASSSQKSTSSAPLPSSTRKRTPEIEERYQALLASKPNKKRDKPSANASLEERRNQIYGTPKETSGKKKKAVKKSAATFSTGPRQRSARIARKKRQERIRAKRIHRIIFIILVLLVLAAAFFAYKKRDKIVAYFQDKAKDQQETQLSKSEIMDKAELLAAGYDYDGAIAQLQTIENYEEDTEITASIEEWESVKKNLVEFKAEDVTHIFYHTLVRDTTLAFECEPSVAEGFKEWMTTIPEFDKITQTMYDEGYVLCSLYDFFDETYDEDGTPHFTEKSVYLPEGKKPFVLSIDDLSYYHTYTGHGMATKLVLDDNGKITCEYQDEDGKVETGSFDCVPRMNDFLEEHPDGAYHGARGTIALTGYNGVFGYRTDESYVTQENLDADKKEWLEDNPDYDYDKEVASAKAIAEELKAEGWTFASHTWGHIRVGKTSLEKIKIDTEKWLKNVEPIIGETECIIFAHGQDLSSTDDYDTDTNKKYQYLASKGFHIFLNVDSHQKTMKVHDLYVHGGRRNLDGYRLWSDAHGNSDWTSDLFDAKDILDSRRKDVPTPTE